LKKKKKKGGKKNKKSKIAAQKHSHQRITHTFQVLLANKRRRGSALGKFLTGNSGDQGGGKGLFAKRSRRRGTIP